MSICPSVVHLSSVVCLHYTFKFRIIAVVSKNVTNKSRLVYSKSKKYAFWVTKRPLGSMRQSKARPRISKLKAHLGCTHEAGTS